MTEPPDEILTPEEVGHLIKLDPEKATSTLRRWRYERRGPTFFSLNYRTVRYRKADVLEWIRERELATRTVNK